MQPQFFRSYGTHQIVAVIAQVNIDSAVTICTRQDIVIVIVATWRGEPIVVRDTELTQLYLLNYSIL